MTGKLRNMTSLYLLQGEKILLLYRIGSRVVKDCYTGSAGGHFEPEELNDPKACVLRELKEELDLEEKHLRGLALRYITLRQMSGEVRQNYYFFAELAEDVSQLASREGISRWVEISDLDRYEMPFTAKHMLRHYVQTGRHTTALYGGVTTESGVVFAPMEED